ncbi:MAG TPA: hypothetical protein PLK85_04410, partial [Alphaproteobacteria bacterium]|nr:hypothetical protein [Alphaproteobacteria bacterium]
QDFRGLENMKSKIYSLINRQKQIFPALLLALASFVFTKEAAAQQTLGTTIMNLVNGSADVPGVIIGFSYLMAIFFGIMGIMKLKEHVENPNSVSLWDPVKRFMAGGALFAFPSVYHAIDNTISRGLIRIAGSNFNTGGVSGTGLDASLVSLMQDIWRPLQYLFIAFGYLAGIILILIGISRLLKTEQEGARGPLGFGTIMTFLVGGVMLSQTRVMAAFVTSMFGGNATNNATLVYKAGMSNTAIGHSEAVIGAIMSFVAILGWISFIRGFFIMRGVAEGNSQASAMAGFTHIIGGAIAVNLGGFITAVQNTLGITNYGLKVSDAAPYILDTVTAFV